MQSVNHQTDAPYDGDNPGMAEPVRPEPMVPDRLRVIGQADPARDGVRAELADAFRLLGRGRHPKAAYRQAKELYRSSDHEWSRGLK